MLNVPGDLSKTIQEVLRSLSNLWTIGKSVRRLQTQFYWISPSTVNYIRSHRFNTKHSQFKRSFWIFVQGKLGQEKLHFHHLFYINPVWFWNVCGVIGKFFVDIQRKKKSRISVSCPSALVSSPQRAKIGILESQLTIQSLSFYC